MSGACHNPRGLGYGLLLGTPYIEYIENRPHPARHNPRGLGYGLLLGTPYIEYIENRPHPAGSIPIKGNSSP
jgi:hypothetical protein